MRVIAIDPGYDRLGVAVMENTSGVETLVYSACIESSRADTLSDRLVTVGE
jgi:Holliday junction resolvasome RuvABC endonuclease subunit